MAKVPVQFTLNGEEKAEFVDSGTTLLKALRDKIGDTSPKGGCHQGTCGACSVIIDGELQALLPDAGRDLRRRRRSDHRGPRRGRRAASAAARLPRRLRRAMRLLHAGHDHGGQGAARPHAQPEPRGGGRGAVAATSAAAPATSRSSRRCSTAARANSQQRGLRGRHDGTAQELFRRPAQGRPARDRPGAAALGCRRAMSPARPPISPTAIFPACCISRWCAARTITPASARIDTSEAEKHPGVVRILTAKDVPHNVYTILILIQVGPEDEHGAGRRQGALEGRGRRGGAGRQRARRQRGRRQGQGRLRGAAGRLRHGGGAEARRADRQRISRPELLLYDSGECRKVRFGDVEKGFAEADHILEQTYWSSPIEHAPTETTGCIVVPEGNDRFTCYTNTQAMFFTLDNTSIILQMPGQQAAFRRRHGRRRLRRQGRRHRRADRHPRRQADRPAGLLHLQPRGGDADLLAARRRKDRHQGRRHEGWPHRRPQGHRLHRCRRLFAPLALWRAEGRRRTIPAPTPSRMSGSTPTASTPTARRRRPCAASASPSPTSRWRCRWTSWRG